MPLCQQVSDRAHAPHRVHYDQHIEGNRNDCSYRAVTAVTAPGAFANAKSRSYGFVSLIGFLKIPDRL